MISPVSSLLVGFNFSKNLFQELSIFWFWTYFIKMKNAKNPHCHKCSKILQNNHRIKAEAKYITPTHIYYTWPLVWHLFEVHFLFISSNFIFILYCNIQKEHGSFVNFSLSKLMFLQVKLSMPWFDQFLKKTLTVILPIINH